MGVFHVFKFVPKVLDRANRLICEEEKIVIFLLFCRFELVTCRVCSLMCLFWFFMLLKRFCFKLCYELFDAHLMSLPQLYTPWKRLWRFEVLLQQTHLSVNLQHCEFNLCHANVPFLYPLKTTENQRKPVVWKWKRGRGGMEMEH